MRLLQNWLARDSHFTAAPYLTPYCTVERVTRDASAGSRRRPQQRQQLGSLALRRRHLLVPRAIAFRRAACAQAVHILHPNGQIERAGRACLTVLQLIGCPSILVRFMRLPPLIWTLEIGYWLVARNRSLFSKIFFR